ncbi:Xylose import ATP-binding protein XylG [Methylobacterium crusticola]|uniref:Xylose import ATP-binding protein XylG n=1 Tax=Methylobacterium crusticola TaxID=1697972 RepID=A0ABQ4R1D8_9HYPH|nr:ABC transporter ATP-binding protein [Methylobacterium crusticola]GJD51488.1 Xylose import ATP-binding protein XylG [Methylobacterium crusticola]
MPGAAPHAPVVLELRGITKRFGGVLANDAIDLDLRRGEILALLGENGAGKTTLMNILFGHYTADAGSVRVAGADGRLAPLPPGRPRAALRAGIGMVHQHFALADALSGLDNVTLGTEPLWRPRRRLAQARRRLDGLMRDSGLAVDLDVPTGRLGVGERQRVEILKALYRDVRVLILDEPTAVLTPAESEGLFAILRNLAGRGLAVAFISHKLGEVVAGSDRVAVLRAGRKVAERPTAGADRAALAALMVGRAVQPSRRTPRAPGPEVLALAAVTVAGEGARNRLEGASLTVRAGEIVGIAGVAGNGQAALARLLCGLARPSAGSLHLHGRALTRFDPGSFVRGGVGRIPEDRHHEGAVPAMSVAENIAIEGIRTRFQRAGLLRLDAIAARAREAIAAYGIRAPGPDAPIRLLSGGNMQKAILARALDGEPALILAAQPTRGLDVGAVAEIHARLLAARARGAATVLISEDLDELFALCDRIAVMVHSRLSPALPAESLDLTRLGLMMAGQDPAASLETSA